jgi:hypothetical protein
MDEQTDGWTGKGLLQIPSENKKVRTIASKFHQNPTFPSEDIKILCRLIKYARNLRTSNLRNRLMYSVAQASFIKIPPFLPKISRRKHSANQIAAASLNIHRIC